MQQHPVLHVVADPVIEEATAVIVRIRHHLTLPMEVTQAAEVAAACLEA